MTEEINKKKLRASYHSMATQSSQKAVYITRENFITITLSKKLSLTMTITINITMTIK